MRKLQESAARLLASDDGWKINPDAARMDMRVSRAWLLFWLVN